jgi:hypothetical protein
VIRSSAESEQRTAVQINCSSMKNNCSTQEQSHCLGGKVCESCHDKELRDNDDGEFNDKALGRRPLHRTR